MIYKPSFIRMFSRKQMLMGRDTEIHRQQDDLISIHLFYESGKKVKCEESDKSFPL
jgi:hypothetical protein